LLRGIAVGRLRKVVEAERPAQAIWKMSIESAERQHAKACGAEAVAAAGAGEEAAEAWPRVRLRPVALTTSAWGEHDV